MEATMVVPAVLLLGAGAVWLHRFRASILIPCVSLIGATALSCYASTERDAWKRAGPLLLASLAAVFLGASLRSSPSRKAATALLLLAGAAVVLYGLHQVLFGLEASRRALESDPTFPDRQLYLERLRLGRPFARFSLPGLLGGYLSMLTFVAGGIAVGGRGMAERVAGGVLALASMLLLALTMSLGAIASLALALGLLLLTRAPGKTRRFLLVGLAAAVIALGSASVVRFSREGLGRGSLALRASNWTAAMKVFRLKPVLGVGPGAFAYFYPRFILSGGNNTQHAHSLLMRSLAETGIFGAASVTALVVFALRALVRVLGASSPTDVGFGLAAIAGILHGLVDIDFDVESLSILTPFLVGLAIAPVLPGGVPSRPWSWKLVRIVVSVALLAATLPYLAQSRAREALDEARLAVFEGRRDDALPLLLEAIRRDGTSSTGRLSCGMELLSSGRPQEAVKPLEEARAISPDRGLVAVLLAEAYAAVGRGEDAREQARQAVRLIPWDPSAREAYRLLFGEEAPGPPK